MSTTYDLTDPAHVLAWARQCAQDGPASDEDVTRARRLAHGMRLRQSWNTHRDHVHGLVSVSPWSNKTNRLTLSKAIRALCYAMDRADEESPKEST